MHSLDFWKLLGNGCHMEPKLSVTLLSANAGCAFPMSKFNDKAVLWLAHDARHGLMESRCIPGIRQ